jgi:hypothetical protein
MKIVVSSIKIRKSFSFLETVIVIFIVSIIIFFAKDIFNHNKDNLYFARDFIKNQIRFTQNMALIDNKFSTISKDLSKKEKTVNKYFFRQRLQFRIRDNRGSDPYIYAEIYSNYPKSSVFDIDSREEEFLKNPLTKLYLTGNEKIESFSKMMNLTKYFNIDRIEISENDFDTNMHNNFGDGFRLLFDDIGRPYFAEFSTSKKCTSEFNPFDLCRVKPLQETLQIKLLSNNDSVCFSIEPLSGYTYNSDCSF